MAKVILEKQGMTVKLKDIDENTVWPALDSGTIDANLEVWPSGHAKDIDTYITTKKSVVDGGLLGPTGHIGWFIPKFVADAHPEFKTWEGLKTDAAAKYFTTAETGDKGQFLLGDPSYVSYDADIIKNLDSAVQGRGRWRRGGAHHGDRQRAEGRDAVALLLLQPAVEVANPEFADCRQRRAARNHSRVHQVCGRWGQGSQVRLRLPARPLDEGDQRPARDQEPGAFNFLKNMKLTDEDQNTVTSYKNEDGMTIEAAAQKWVDDNESTWQAWSDDQDRTCVSAQ